MGDNKIKFLTTEHCTLTVSRKFAKRTSVWVYNELSNFSVETTIWNAQQSKLPWGHVALIKHQTVGIFICSYSIDKHFYQRYAQTNSKHRIHKARQQQLLYLFESSVFFFLWKCGCDTLGNVNNSRMSSQLEMQNTYLIFCGFIYSKNTFLFAVWWIILFYFTVLHDYFIS